MAAISTVLAKSFTQYMRFYRDYAETRWDNMTPMQYGILLITVGVFGWLLMKSGSKKY